MPAAAGSFLLNIPNADLSAVAKTTDIQALQKTLDQHIQAVQDALTLTAKHLSDQMAALAANQSQAPAPNPNPNPAPNPTPGPAPGNAPWPADIASPGATISLPAGKFAGAQHTGNPGIIRGAGMRQTILDGQGGIGAGHRLAWGKGIIHAGAPITVQGIGFVNGGGGDGKSDAEAGFYAEGFDGAANIVLCAFDGGENGIFVPGRDLANLDLTIDRSVFGRVAATGLDDGRSHDLYVSPRSVTIRGSVFAGTSRGNTVKSRSPKLLLENNYIARSNGRWVDLPGGTDCVSRGNVYVTNPDCNVQNAFGFYDEGDTGVSLGAGSFVSDGDTFYFSRAIGEHIWINHPNFRVEFRNARVFWVGRPGSPPPPIVIDGPGQITGPNPFILGPDNRVDAAPALPGDPT